MNLIKAAKRYCEEHQLERFAPWNIRECVYCLYPLSEKVRFKKTPSGKAKKEYCCNICYEIRENNVARKKNC